MQKKNVDRQKRGFFNIKRSIKKIIDEIGAKKQIYHCFIIEGGMGGEYITTSNFRENTTNSNLCLY